MTQKINQLCQIIAKHPSKINLLNEALTLAIQGQRSELFKPIIDLLRQIELHSDISQFVKNKLKAVFLTLLNISIQKPEQLTFQLLGECFTLTEQRTALGRQFIESSFAANIAWNLEWPANLLIQAFEILSLAIEQQKQVRWPSIVRLIVGLPPFTELKMKQEVKGIFKKNFQKLLLSTLSSKHIDRDHLHQIYHNLGEKVLSKLQSPLILSNHCIERFANDAQLQIEILACLFVLVGKYGLELQQFYPKLQSLVKYRKEGFSVYELPNSRRFFKLIQAALRSSRVPYKTVSTFAHMLITQLAGEESQFAFWALSFIVNLTKKHRKLLDELPQLPQIKMLKYHYSPKIKALMRQLSKNLNRVDFLQIQEFGKVDCKLMTAKKMQSLFDSLVDEEIQFKIPVFQDPL